MSKSQQVAVWCLLLVSCLSSFGIDWPPLRLGSGVLGLTIAVGVTWATGLQLSERVRKLEQDIEALRREQGQQSPSSSSG